MTDSCSCSDGLGDQNPPRVMVMNFTNPMTPICGAVEKAKGIKEFIKCASLHEYSRRLPINFNVWI